MKNAWIAKLAATCLALSLAACAGKGGGNDSSNHSPGTEKQPDHGPAVGDVVVKSTYKYFLSSDTSGIHISGNSVTIPISGINAPNTSMTVNSAGLVVPPITNAVISLGEVSLSSLMDNNLRVCGKDGKTKCTGAVIRVYTTNATVPGMWNANENAAMFVSLGNSAPLTIGLEAANAAVVQTQAIGSTKNVFRLSDFATTPSYKFSADFTNNGAGTYSATLVIEYGLTL